MASGTEDGHIKKRFVTEAELEERRRVRQEEWEKVRKPDDPQECPEEVYDPRSLYERLQEQKEKKQSEFEEQFKFKNMVRGLDEDETNYLDEVSRQRLLLEKQRRDEDDKELKEYRIACTRLTENAESRKDTERKVTAKPTENKHKFSQAQLLAGAVKRKRNFDQRCPDLSMPLSTSSETVKKQKVDIVEGSGQGDEVSCDQTQFFSTGVRIEHPSASVCVGILPGLGAYSGSSDSDAESSSDSDIIINTGGRIISSVFRSHPFPESP